jgi:PAS domain S-box-containing protein
VVPEQFSLALEQAADSVLITNRDGVIEYVNPAFEVMAGFARCEAIGRTPALLRSGVQTPRFYATLWNTILSGRPFQSVLTNRTRDGRLFDEEQTISPIRDSAGAITHFLSTGRDVTHTRRSEAARLHQLLEQESARVASLLHADTGQLLTSAHLALSSVSRTADPEARATLDDVRRTLARVEQQLRRVARGAQPRVIADLGLVDAIRYLAEDCASRTGVSLSVESTVDRRCTATAETLVYRFVQETLSRVQRASEHEAGAIALRREVCGRRAQDETLCCSIRLAASGDELGAAFEDGNGALGLRLVRERFESVGGSLAVFAAVLGHVELRASVPMGA